MESGLCFSVTIIRHEKKKQKAHKLEKKRNQTTSVCKWHQVEIENSKESTKQNHLEPFSRVTGLMISTQKY